MRERFREMDALRGLAALTVVCYHGLECLPDLGGWLFRAPFNNGAEAVLLFFVLSGFVLNLPFLAPEAEIGYGRFLLRRVCRIYLPFLVAIGVSYVLRLAIGWRPLDGLGPGFNTLWAPSIGLLYQLDLLGHFADFSLDPVVWSLVVELRVALVFPLLALMTNRLPAVLSLACALALDVGSVELNNLVARQGVQTDLIMTLHYIPAFVAGMLLARYRAALVRAWLGLGHPARAVLLALSLGVLYKHSALYQRLLAHLPARSWAYYAVEVFGWAGNEWLAVVGVVGVMVAALGSGRWLRHPGLGWLGDISFSLYLYHAVFLAASIRLGFGHLPLPALVLGALAAAFPAAWLSWRYVERPAIALGRRLAPAQAPGTELRPAA